MRHESGLQLERWPVFCRFKYTNPAKATPFFVSIMMLRNLAVALSIVLFAGGCASSSYTIVGQVRPQIDPGDVEIFTSPPRHYEEIALLDASSAGGFGRASEAGTDEAIYRMKEQAAKLGANGVLLTGIGDQYGGSLGFGVGGFGVSGGHSHVTAGGGSVGFGGPIVHKGVQGVAIYVPGRR
jgi:hypothetical protein